jgi:hypothetical protein
VGDFDELQGHDPAAEDDVTAKAEKAEAKAEKAEVKEESKPTPSPGPSSGKH